MQLPSNNFSPFQLLPTLLSLAEARRREEEDAPFKQADLEYKRAQMQHMLDIERQARAKEQQDLNNQLSQQDLAAIDNALYANNENTQFHQTQAPEMLRQFVDTEAGVPDSSSVPIEQEKERLYTEGVGGLKRLLADFDSNSRALKQMRRQTILGNSGAFEKMFSPEQFGKFVMGDEAKQLKPKENYEPVNYEGQPVGFWDYTSGKPVFHKLEGAAGGKLRTEDLWDQYIKSGDFYKALSLSKGTVENNIVIRRAGMAMEANPELQAKMPDIWKEYNNLKLEDTRKGVFHFSSSVTNEKGTTVFEEKEYDPKTGKITVIDRKEGKAETVPTGFITQALEKLPVIDEAIKKLDIAWQNITPQNQNYQAQVKRFGERLAQKLSNKEYNPSKDAEGNAIVDYTIKQVGLMIARVETGAARPEAEIVRINQAYLSGELSYWEVIQQMKLLKEDLMGRKRSYESALNRQPYVPYKSNVNFESEAPGSKYSTPKSKYDIKVKP